MKNKGLLAKSSTHLSIWSQLSGVSFIWGNDVSFEGPLAINSLVYADKVPVTLTRFWITVYVKNGTPNGRISTIGKRIT